MDYAEHIAVLERKRKKSHPCDVGAAVDRQNEFHSHDHGWFLPPSGPSWDEFAITNVVDNAHEFGDHYGDVGLNHSAAETMASALESITRAELVGVLREIPSNWPATNSQLEAVGFFLQRRAPAVAKRLRTRFGGLKNDK